MPRSRSRSAAARTILAVMAALICLLACPYGTAAAAHKMFRKQTEHYLVETDISPRFTAVVGRHMEAIFREYSRRLEGFGQMHVPFKVMVFGKEEDYLKAVPASVRGSTGVFIARDLVLAAHAAMGRFVSAPSRKPVVAVASVVLTVVGLLVVAAAGLREAYVGRDAMRAVGAGLWLMGVLLVACLAVSEMRCAMRRPAKPPRHPCARA